MDKATAFLHLQCTTSTWFKKQNKTCPRCSERPNIIQVAQLSTIFLQKRIGQRTGSLGLNQQQQQQLIHPPIQRMDALPCSWWGLSFFLLPRQCREGQ